MLLESLKGVDASKSLELGEDLFDSKVFRHVECFSPTILFLAENEQVSDSFKSYSRETSNFVFVMELEHIYNDLYILT